jgi:4-phospho-D-threonate 3-dehydrogenase / 4-phospho-D-erythronate 3-dehydrogenase
MSPNNIFRPVIGITAGDVNGIGVELIIKSLSDNRILDLCTPVVFGSNKLVNFYRKSVPDINFTYQSGRDFAKLNNKQVNVYNCWEEEIAITPGQVTETGGKYAIESLMQATDALKNGYINGLVTAPIHKKNIQSDQFRYTGHTPFLRDYFGVKDVAMLMTCAGFRVALLTEHIPLAEVAGFVTREAIMSKIQVIKESLIKDFGIDKPRIAVLGLNPHAGDEGLIGKEEESIIKPAVKDARNNNTLVYGPYSADAFFARHQHMKFDAVLALYHDQGLIPFKSLAFGDGVNFTAGLPVVRTSPDHGTAFDIAGKNKADAGSMLAAIFECIDILKQRALYADNRSNPMRKLTPSVLANAVDERIEDVGLE